jgi:putative transposase
MEEIIAEDTCMGRPFEFSINEFYHIYNRGTEQREIFSDDSDRLRFTNLLFTSNSSKIIHLSDCQGSTLTEVFSKERGDQIIDIGAYCLMPNHFHLLAREKQKGGISLFMQKLSTAYTMFFNKKYERNGSLFQGRFKATHANTDTYLEYLFAYIHLNPVKLIQSDWKEKGMKHKNKAEKFLREYQYSSYLDYLGENTARGLILNRPAFPNYFVEEKDFSDFLKTWLTNSHVKVQP